MAKCTSAPIAHSNPEANSQYFETCDNITSET